MRTAALPCMRRRQALTPPQGLVFCHIFDNANMESKPFTRPNTHELFEPDCHWSNLTSDELWGSRRWEAQVLDACVLLDTAMDPDAWSREEPEADADAEGTREGAAAGDDDECGDE